MDDIRALGVNDAEDELRFETAARVSEINRGIYEKFAAPAIRMAVTEQTAEQSRATHPSRVRFGVFSDQNPMMQPVKGLAETVRAARQPVSADNPFVAVERAASDWITTCLRTYGELRDTMTEAAFLNTYGSPWLQAMVGLGAQNAAPQRIERDLVREASTSRLRSDLEHRFDVGGLEEAALRALAYIRLPEGSIDERGFSVLRQIHASRPVGKRMTLRRFKDVLREQYQLVRLDEQRAIDTLPALLGTDAAGARRRSICCVASSPRMETSPEKPRAAWLRLKRCSMRKPEKLPQGRASAMPEPTDTAERTPFTRSTNG